MDLTTSLEYMIRIIPKLLTFLPTTIYLTILSLLFAVLIALAVAVVQLNKIPVLEKIANFYVLIARACPLMVQVYLVYFGIPLLTLYLTQRGMFQQSIAIPAIYLAVIALSLNYGAYISQVFRAALLSVDKGQMEAAESIGMPWHAGFFRIVLPQAVCYMLPPFTSQLLNLFKSTSILFCISVQDLMAGAKLEAAASYRYLECFFAAAAVYWIICTVVEKLVQLYSKRAMVFLKG